MSSIFQHIIVAAIVGTILLSIIAAIKPVTIKLFSKTWHYYMCLVPAIFFLGVVGLVSIPVQIIWAYLSSHTPAVHTNVAATVSVQDVLPAARTVVTDVYVHSLNLAEWNETMYVLQSVGWAREILSLLNTPILMNFIVLVWIVGAIMFATANAWRYLAYRKILLQNARVCVSVESPVVVVFSKSATTPMIIGFFRPVIVLPDIDFSSHELDMILAHELTHFRRKDTWLKFVILITNTVQWFNPAAYLLTRYMNNLCELSCDEKVVIEMNAQERKFYGETILSMLQYSKAQKVLICASGLCCSQKNIKRRLVGMLNAKKTRKLMVALSLALTLVITGIGGVTAYGLRNDSSIDDTYVITTPTVIPADENIYGNIIVDGGSLLLYGHVNGVITVASGSSLIISGTGQVNGTVSVYGSLHLNENGIITGAGTRGVVVNHGGVFILNGGYVRGNSYTYNGGGVWVNGGILVIRSGYIIENTSYAGGGGGIFIHSGDIMMYGGYIRNNHSNQRGGGVLVSSRYASFTMHGGVIIENTVRNGQKTY